MSGYNDIMKIGRRNYELQWLAILFEVVDDDEHYVCGIGLSDLDKERGGMIDGEEGLSIFDQRSSDTPVRHQND